MKSLYYILPKSNFFNQGERGRVTHALGVAEGFSKNNWNVHILSGEGLTKFRTRVPDSVKLIEVCDQADTKNGERLWRKRIMDRLRADIEPSSCLLVRYTISIPFFLYKVARITKREKNILTIVEVNSLAYHNLKKIPLPIRRLIAKFECFVVNKYDVIYVVSDSLRKDLVKHGARSKIVVVPNASSIRIQNLRRNEKIIRKSRFLYLGVMRPYYDFKLLVDAFKVHSSKHTMFSLHFYGYGDLESEIQTYAKNHKKIFFHGKYDNEDLEKIVNFGSDILILPYKNNLLTNIGSPTKLFEYMSLGLPVLASNVGQINDIIIDEYNGYLYDPDNVNSLIDKMEFIARNSLSSKDVGQQGLRDLLSKHTWEVRIKSMIDNLSQLQE